MSRGVARQGRSPPFAVSVARRGIQRRGATGLGHRQGPRSAAGWLAIASGRLPVGHRRELVAAAIRKGSPKKELPADDCLDSRLRSDRVGFVNAAHDSSDRTHSTREQRGSAPEDRYELERCALLLEVAVGVGPVRRMLNRRIHLLRSLRSSITRRGYPTKIGVPHVQIAQRCQHNQTRSRATGRRSC
jgi:hypothetical protein